MKRVLLTGINGTVAQVLQKELAGRYQVSGLSVVRMDDVLRVWEPAKLHELTPRKRFVFFWRIIWAKHP